MEKTVKKIINIKREEEKAFLFYSAKINRHKEKCENRKN